MKISETAKGELSVFGESLLSSMLPILGIITFKTLPPLYSLFGSILFTTIFFVILLTLKKSWQSLSKQNFKILFWIVLLIGVGYHGLSYIGLELTSANNASIIWQSELLFSFLYFNVWRKEQLSLEHLTGAGLMLFGIFLIFFPQLKSFQFNKGDILILCATALPPIGNYYQREIRKKMNSLNVIFWRNLMTFPVLLVLILLLPAKNYSLTPATILFLALNGLLVFGLAKIFWLEAISRISITKANALASIRPFLTIVLSYLILQQKPNLWQMLAVIPIVFGVMLLTKK